MHICAAAALLPPLLFQGSPLERLKSAWNTASMADQLLFIVDAEKQVATSMPCSEWIPLAAACKCSTDV